MPLHSIRIDRRICLAVNLLFVLCWTLQTSSHCFGDDNAVRIGFDNKIKLGSWIPFFVDEDSAPKATRFEITAPDGNGIPVIYTGQLERAGQGRGQAWFKLGREVSAFSYRLLDSDDNEVRSGQIDLRQNNVEILDSTLPFCLTIEPDENIVREIKSLESQMFDREIEVAAINDAAELPLNFQCLQSIQIIYVVTSSAELINSITEEQWQAMERWVSAGGKLIIGVGVNCDALLSESKPLSRFLPGKFSGVGEIQRSAKFEQFTQSRRGQLLKRGDPPIPCAQIEDPNGIVELTVTRNPIVIRRPYEFGQIVFSGVDFDSDAFSEWAGQKNYLLRLSFGQLNLNRTLTGESDSRSVVRRGYNDILGQLVFPLEKFSNVQFINFTIVAILIALFILCIGPGDYFLLRKAIGKMEWTWLTFTIVAASFCGLAIWMSGATKPSKIQINQLEIVDFDVESEKVRGNVWTNIYSPSNTKCSVKPPSSNALGLDTSESLISWMGIPGDGLGSMRSNTSAGLFVQNYSCELSSNSASKLSQLPVKVSSTKSLTSQYFTNKKLPKSSRLRLNPTTNQLQGTITNPFDFEIRNCRVLFENWAYILPTPLLQPGETVDVFVDMKERTATSYLSRRQDTEDNKGGDIPWDPNEDDIGRIAEMMMFHKSVGGRRFTRLTHGFQPYLDMTEQLYLRRAVLFGEVDNVCTKLEIETDADEIEYDQSLTYVRVVLPVEYKK